MPRPKNPTLAKVLILRFLFEMFLFEMAQWSDH